jgi:hypothetical protein
MDFAPKRNKLLRLSRARTAPMAAPERAHQWDRFRSEFVELPDDFTEFKRSCERRTDHFPGKAA